MNNGHTQRPPSPAAAQYLDKFLFPTPESPSPPPPPMPMPTPTHNRYLLCCYRSCCCFCRYDDDSPTISRSTRGRSATTALMVLFLIVCYICGGAVLFMGLERYEEEAMGRLNITMEDRISSSNTALANDDIRQFVQKNGARLRAEAVDRLWSLTENLNILYRENWTRLAAEEVLLFQDTLFRQLVNEGKAAGPSSSHTQTLELVVLVQINPNWTFASACLYSLTLITTIGYGSVSPRSLWGRIATMAYALIGIPLMLLYLSTSGDLLARLFRGVFGWSRASIPISTNSSNLTSCQCVNRPREEQSRIGSSIPFTLCLLLITCYITGSAFVLHRLERSWSLLQCWYFCFTSLSTIGMGDLVSSRRRQNFTNLFYVYCTVYIMIGMALLAMCFAVMQQEVAHLLRTLGNSSDNSHKVALVRPVQPGNSISSTAALTS